MSNNSIIEHRANYYFVKLHEDYLAITGGDHCQALCLSVLEEWTNAKRAKNKGLWVSLTYPQWIQAIYGFYKRTYIVQALEKLEGRGFISRREITVKGNRDSYEYLLNVKAVNDALREIATKSPFETLPNLDAYKNGRIQNCMRPNLDDTHSNLDAIPVQICTGHAGDAYKNGRLLESITEITITQIPTENEGRDASASACAPPADAALSEENLDENTPTEKVAAIRPDIPPVQVQQQIAPTKRESARQQKPSRLSKGEPERGVLVTPPPVAPGPSAEASRILDLWDSTFSRQQPRTAANIEAAQQLVPCQPTAEELKTCRVWLFTTDDSKRPWFRKKGVSLADVAKNFSNWQSLQDAAPRQPDKPVEEDPYSWEAMKRRSDARQKEREQEVLV